MECSSGALEGKNMVTDSDLDGEQLCYGWRENFQLAFLACGCAISYLGLLPVCVGRCPLALQVFVSVAFALWIGLPSFHSRSVGRDRALQQSRGTGWSFGRSIPALIMLRADRLAGNPRGLNRRRGSGFWGSTLGCGFRWADSIGR